MKINNLKPVALAAMMALSMTVGAGHAKADESGIVFKQASTSSAYCHIKYMAFKSDTLRNPEPEFNPSDVIDRYGACDFDPKSKDEVQRQLSFHQGRETAPLIGGDSSSDD